MKGERQALRARRSVQYRFQAAGALKVGGCCRAVECALWCGLFPMLSHLRWCSPPPPPVVHGRSRQKAGVCRPQPAVAGRAEPAQYGYGQIFPLKV